MMSKHAFSFPDFSAWRVFLWLFFSVEKEKNLKHLQRIMIIVRHIFWLIYACLEPVCPLFWVLNPPNKCHFHSKQGSFGGCLFPVPIFLLSLPVCFFFLESSFLFPRSFFLFPRFFSVPSLLTDALGRLRLTCCQAEGDLFCRCSTCSMVDRLEKRLCFFGPSPRTLFKELRIDGGVVAGVSPGARVRPRTLRGSDEPMWVAEVFRVEEAVSWWGGRGRLGGGDAGEAAEASALWAREPEDSNLQNAAGSRRCWSGARPGPKGIWPLQPRHLLSDQLSQRVFQSPSGALFQKAFSQRAADP